MLLLGAGKSASEGKRGWCAFHLDKTFLISLVIIVSALSHITSAWDPYDVLGVRRDATSDQIKRAYRDLAKKHHPDKRSTNDNDAGKRFIEINKAFDILKDPAKRTKYDQHGTIDESRHSRGGYHSRGGNDRYHQFRRQAQENWAAHSGFRTFTFYTSSGGPPDSYLRKKTINSRQYFNDYMKESRHRPFLVFFYTDFCPSCHMIESTWAKITNELAKHNVGAFTINVHMEPRLSSELGVSTIPHIACLLDERLYHYSQSEISLPSFVRFIKNLLPSNLVPLLRTLESQDRHISQMPGQGNRLSAIIINSEKNLKLRYLLLAHSLQQYYKFAHVSTKLSDYEALVKQYNLTLNYRSHILVFDERHSEPKLHLQYDPDDGVEQLSRQLLAWPFLKLPRLSSQQMFDDLCLYAIPKEGETTIQKLCVILVTPSTPSSLPSRRKLLEFIDLNGLSQDKKVIFTYLDPKKQNEFVQSILLETASKLPKSLQDGVVDQHVILLQRQADSNRKARYLWLQNRWDPTRANSLDAAKIELYQYVDAYKRGMIALEDKVLLTPLIDEDGPTLIERIYSRTIDYLGRLIYLVTTRETVPTVVMMLGCALLASLFLYKSPVPTSPESDFRFYRSSANLDATNVKKKSNLTTDRPAPVIPVTHPDFKILELKAETYNGMVRLLRPGFRTIVLLTDAESKEKLLENFRQAVWPYRKNRTLLFGYLCLDKNLEWYKKLLEEVLGCDDLNVNKKNCIGTVLSLNGFKKYFRVYHAKHHEIDYYDDDTENDGSFLGFNDVEANLGDDPELGAAVSNGSIGRTAKIYTVDNLLDRLPIWLDKMFDGLTKRYFVDEWPDNMK